MQKSIKDQEGANRGNYADIRIKKCQVSSQILNFMYKRPNFFSIFQFAVKISNQPFKALFPLGGKSRADKKRRHYIG